MDVMIEALKQAKKSCDGGKAYGCVIARGDMIIGVGRDTTHLNNDITKHAVMNALTESYKRTKGDSLLGCTCYCTIRPCKMCKEALKQAGVNELVYCKDEDELKILGIEYESPACSEIKEMVENNSYVNEYYLEKVLSKMGENKCTQ